MVVGGVLLSAALLSAQSPIYNPSALQFTHPDYGVTDTYRLELLLDGATTPLYTADIPRGAVADTPPTYTLPFTLAPVAPVGKTYRARLLALNSQGTSPPSNITPETFRFAACALSGATGVQLPSLAVQTWPVLHVGQGVVLTLAIRAPHDVQFVSLDLPADGQPAWYWVTQVAPGLPATAQVFWGPFIRAGRFQVTGQIIDRGGCQADLPSGTFVTVLP